MDSPPPPPAAASAPPTGFCTSAWLEQEEWTSAPAAPAAPGHATAVGDAEAACEALRKKYDDLRQRNTWLQNKVDRRTKELDESSQLLDKETRDGEKLRRRVAELEAAAAAQAAAPAAQAAAPAEAPAADAAAPEAPAAAAEEHWDLENTRTMLSIVPGHDGGAFAQFGSTLCQIPVRSSSKRGIHQVIHQVYAQKWQTSEGSALMFYYVENESQRVYVRVKKSSNNEYSCRVEIRGDALCCGVPIWSSNNDDTPAPIRWETIGRVEWVASPQSASAAAPSELKKRSVPDAASALAVSKAKKKAKIARILGPCLTAQEAEAILQEYGPHGGRGGLYKIVSGPNSRGDVFVNTETGVWIVIDWDLTIDAVSSPCDSNAHAISNDDVRKRIFHDTGYSETNYKDYMLKMYSILLVLAKIREQGYSDIVIVTRNDCRNVEAFINAAAAYAQRELDLSRPSFSDEDFPIIAFPENGVPENKKKSKAQLLAEHVPHIKKTATNVVFVDDSHGIAHGEHERFRLSARGVFAPETVITHVMVERCPRYDIMTKRGKRRTRYGKQGLGNQPHMLDKIAAAITSSEHPGTWAGFAKDHLGLSGLDGHEGVFRE